MKELEQIADQLTRSVEGDAWHGPALNEVLVGINAEKAFAKSISNVHSIWEIVNHISAWQKAVVVRMEFKTIELDGEDDWPPVKDRSESSWQKSLDELDQSYKNLKEKILIFPEEKLEEKVPGRGNYNFYVLIHGVIQHNLYHAGQIAILKKSLYNFL